MIVTTNHQKDHELYGDILKVISHVFIEIRASDNLKMAQYLSDIFHNAPVEISNKRDPREIEKDIFLKASRLECEEYVRSLFNSVRKKR